MTSIGCVDGADGGHGLLVLAGIITPVARLLDNSIAGGQGGLTDVICSQGSAGQGVAIWSAVADVQGLTGSGRSTEAEPAVVATGQPGTLAYQGEPGEQAFALVSLDSSPLYLEPLLGTLVPAPVPIVLSLGTTDATGAASLAFTGPALAAGDKGVTLHLQGAGVDAVGAVRLASPTWLTATIPSP